MSVQTVVQLLYWASIDTIKESMEFNELINAIKVAIDACANRIKVNPEIILTEADLERHLSNEIDRCLCMQKENPFSVHNQISHYPYPSECLSKENKRDYQVDILVMKNADLQKGDIHHKEFIYYGDSVAMELKYYREKDSIATIEKDLKKADSILNDNYNHCAFFVVALLEDKSKQAELCKYFEKYKNVENMYMFILTKNSL